MSTKNTFFTLALFLILGWTTAGSTGPVPDDPPGLLPRQYIGWMENLGQHGSDCQFNTFSYSGQVFLNSDNSLLYFLNDNEGKSLSFRENIIGSRSEHRYVRGLDQQETKVNFIKGDKKDRITGIPCFNALDLGEMWPNIRVQLWKSGNSVEKVFFLDPGSDPEQIQVEIEGVEDMCIDEDNQLQVDHATGSYYFSEPIGWQKIDGQRNDISVRYTVAVENGNFSYGFHLEEYDSSYPVAIDPILASTNLAGNGYETANSIALDNDGNVFIAGNTISTDLPVSQDAFDTSYNDTEENYDGFVAKYNSDLSMLLSCTYIGGGEIDQIFDLIIDNQNHVVLTGSTRSEDFPSTPGAYDNSYNGGVGNSITTQYGDIFISILQNDLSDLLASTFIGGEYREWGSNLLVDSNNDIYLAGICEAGLPKVGPQFYADFQDAFFLKINNSLSTLLATNSIKTGSLYAGIADMCWDNMDNLVVVGSLGTFDELQTTPGAYSTTLMGTRDAFLLKLSHDLSQNLAATYFGGPDQDNGSAVCVDEQNNIYLAGNTRSNPFPVTQGAYDTEHDCDLNNYDAYIAKFNSDLSELMACTYLGGNNTSIGSLDDESVSKLLIDPNQGIYVCGTSESSYFPVNCESIHDYSWSTEAFVAKFNFDLSILAASTFLGDKLKEVGLDMVQNEQKDLYVCGHSSPASYIDDWADSTFAYIVKITADLINYTPCCTYPRVVDGVYLDANCTLDIMWEPSLKATGYYLSVGTSPGNYDIFEQMDVGYIHEYTLEYLPTDQTIYYRIDAYNEFGTAIGRYCLETWLVTTGPKYDYETASICQGDTLYWEGFPMTVPGRYEVLHYAANGCDRIIHLDLEVTPCFHDLITMTMCEGDSIWWFDQYYYEPGHYFQYFETATGCDSTYELVLETCEELTIAPEEKDISIVLYPNPTQDGVVSLKGLNEKIFIQVADLSGHIMKTFNISTDQALIDLADLEAGLYFFIIGEGEKTTIKKGIYSP